MEVGIAIRDLISWGRPEGLGQTPAREGDERPLLALHREVNRLFDDVFRGFDVSPFARSAWPTIEVKRSGTDITIKAELPGLSEKDVEISADGDALTIRGERKSDADDHDNGYSEHFYGRFERHVALPKGVDTEKAKASFKDGILTVSLPLTTEADPGRKIPIEGTAC